MAENLKESRRPLMGERVLYQFDDATAARANRQPMSAAEMLRHGLKRRITFQHGQMCAAIITRVHGNGLDEVNLKLILDAPFDLWVQGIRKWNGVEGSGKNKWRWPLQPND